MLKSKKIIAVLMIVFLIGMIGVQVKATDNNPLDLPLLSANTTANEIAANSIIANAEAANAVAANSAVIQPTINTNTSNNNIQGNNLPQTGVTEDITVMFFIIVCVISAIYAYRKIRAYNI